MTVAIINQTIRAMCIEVKAQDRPCHDWRLLTEDELLYEAVVCIFGSQMVFEVAVLMADRLRECGLLRLQHFRFNKDNYEAKIVATFSDPLVIADEEGVKRLVKPRFKNRLAALLAATVSAIHGCGHSLKGFLLAATSAKDAREVLVSHVWGFGPKQASLFLRRVGYCSDLAVLDIHVLDYLRLARGISLKASHLSRLSFYEGIEDEFREVAVEFGHSLGCVDLATWLTMRVAKREAYL